MKTNNYLNVLILLFTVNICSAQFTPVPDPNFEQALIDLGVDDVMDGQILNFYSYPITSLNVSYKGITDLTGINAFSNLETLIVNNNYLNTIDVSNLPDLETLSVNNNNLEALDINANTLLTELRCIGNNLTSLILSGSIEILYAQDNQLTNLDTSMCTQLEVVRLFANMLETFDASQNPFLIELQLYSNNIASVDVGNCFGLEDLYLYNNPLNNLDVSTNSNLRSLRLQTTGITQLDVTNNSLLSTLMIYNNPQLDTTLDLSQNTLLEFMNSTNTPLSCITVNNITDAENGIGLYDHWSIDEVTSFSEDCSDVVAIPDVNFEQALIDQGLDNVINGMVLRENIDTVEVLNVTNTGISDLAGIEAFVNLFELYANLNHITSIDLSNNSQLQTLFITGNELTTLDISANNNLKELQCINNNIMSLDVSLNTNLEKLNCSQNGMTTLVLSSNLKTLECYGNALETLGLDVCTQIELLNCGSNLLSNVELSSNTLLKYLNISNNMLTSINVSQNSNLLELNAINNQLTNLSIENCLLLEELKLSANAIDQIDVSNNYSLKQLNIGVNNLTTIDVTLNPDLESLILSDNIALGNHLNLTNNTNLTTMYALNTNITCFKVTDEEAANNGEDIYSNWIKSNTAIYSETCDVLGAQDFEDTANFTVYPNPTHNYLNISISNSTFKSAINTVQIVDLTGKVVYNSNSYAEHINVTTLAKGMYILQIKSSQYKTRSKKIIIE